MATFLTPARNCIRKCGFCGNEFGQPSPPDDMEPERVRYDMQKMARYTVITSVTQDDVPDGGASHFAQVIRAIRKLNQEIRVEVLVSDFGGNFLTMTTVLKESPDVLNHNIETIPRLYPKMRPQASYERLLALQERSWNSIQIFVLNQALCLGWVRRGKRSSISSKSERC